MISKHWGDSGKGLRTGMNDGSGSTAWVYDQLGRVLTETKTIAGAGAFQTGYSYDRLGRVRTMTYPDGEVISYTYNAQSLVNSLTTSLTETAYLAGAGYNAQDQPTFVTLGNGLNTSYGYYDPTSNPGQANFRLRTIQTGGGLLQNLSYTYDNGGNVTHLADSATGVTWDYGYDPLDRLTGAERTAGGATESYAYHYDRRNNLTGRLDPTANLNLSLTYPGSGSPQPHAPAQVWDGSELLAEFDYDANGNRTARLSSSGNVTYTYDIENRLSRVISQTGSGVVTTTFLYDGDGQRVKRSAPGGEETCYIGEHFEIRIKLSGSLSWTFDSDLEGWEIGGLARYDNEAGMPAGSLWLTNDSENGSTASSPSLSHVIGPETVIFFYAMRKTNYGDVSIEYDVDSGSGREEVIVHNNYWTRYVIPLDAFAGQTLTGIRFTDGYNVWVDNIVVNEGAGTSTTKHYTTNPLAGTGGQRIATRVDDEVYYIHTDHLGSTTLLTDQSGNEVGRVYYSPYGSVISSTGALPTDRLFTGQRWEPDLGLYDYRARFYDPLVGSFISADTLVPEVGHPRGWNRYGYVYGNPVRYTDPSGHFIFEEEPDDPFTWSRDKPKGHERTLIRGAHWYSFIMWDETQSPELPDGIYSVELNFTGDIPQEYVASLGLISFDDQGNLAIGTFAYAPGTGGSTTLSGNVSLSFTYLDAENLGEMPGWLVNTGPGVTSGLFGGGIDAVLGPEGQNGQITGSSLYFSVGPKTPLPPVYGHVNANKTVDGALATYNANSRKWCIINSCTLSSFSVNR